MKKKKKSNGSSAMVIVTVVVLALAVVSLFGYIVYKNIFASVESKRYEGLDEYKITVDEINGIKEEFNKLNEIDTVNVYTESNKNTKSRIIKIRVNLKEDAGLDVVKEVSNSIVEKLSEENREFFDLEVFVTSDNEESEIYPQIGYKHRSKTEFSW